ncbi:hypothetical protein [Bradyrhizobium sp. SZCCHNRI1073]|uniref:hypothetical protein n=1 Tax=Bradyrhizobium sp. SZCCHNRI1073 TaxID=3057280 RepID=UPI00291672DD|nr:hypothetical protein [Bradyrhizobium sp. SZCCHNRI1073]
MDMAIDRQALHRLRLAVLGIRRGRGPHQVPHLREPEGNIMIMGAGHVTPEAALFWIMVLWCWPFLTIGGLWLILDAWWGR